jgi:hypothetical protein
VVSKGKDFLAITPFLTIEASSMLIEVCIEVHRVVCINENSKRLFLSAIGNHPPHGGRGLAEGGDGGGKSRGFYFILFNVSTD